MQCFISLLRGAHSLQLHAGQQDKNTARAEFPAQVTPAPIVEGPQYEDSIAGLFAAFQVIAPMWVDFWGDLSSRWSVSNNQMVAVFMQPLNIRKLFDSRLGSVYTGVLDGCHACLVTCTAGTVALYCLTELCR